MTTKYEQRTGWPPGLLQDDCRGLSEWFASKPDARRHVRDACALIRRERAMQTTKQRFEDAFNALKVMGVPVYIHPDDRAPRFSISAEDEGADEWVSMYHNDPEWLFGVHPVVHLLLNRFDLFCEWVNPGRLSVYDNALEPPIVERNEP